MVQDKNSSKAANVAPTATEVTPIKHAHESNLSPHQWLYKSLLLVQQSVEERDSRKVLRALRYMNQVRKYVPTGDILKTANTVLKDSHTRSAVQEALNSIMEHEKSHGSLTKPHAMQDTEQKTTDVDETEDIEMKASEEKPANETADAKKSKEDTKDQQKVDKKKKQSPAVKLTLSYIQGKLKSFSQTEIAAYFLFLSISQLIRQQQYEVSGKYASLAFKWAHSLNRRSMDIFTAKLITQLAFAYEKQGTLDSQYAYFLSLHRTACLRHDEIGQATLFNTILRILVHQKQYRQAYKLLMKTSVPVFISNNQQVRYLYYWGKIQAVQLDYSAAFQALNEALRKAPTTTAFAFKLRVQQLLVLVQLLLGEVPEKASFRSKRSREIRGLEPYFALTQAVRVGDVTAFRNVVQKYEKQFTEDDTLSLVLRLRHNVIKTGLKAMASSYNAISFGDVASKLDLDSPEDAEFLCAKAIRDGVIDAVLDGDSKCLRSLETADIYATSEPQEAFHKRISFCLDVHTEAVKSMRYPAEAYKKDFDSMEAERREAEKEELIKDIEDGKFDDDDEEDEF